MGKAGKIIIIVIIGFFGLVLLTIIKESNGSGIGYFGLFGIAMFFVYKSLFKKNDSSTDIEKSDDEIKLKK